MCFEGFMKEEVWILAAQRLSWHWLTSIMARSQDNDKKKNSWAISGKPVEKMTKDELIEAIVELSKILQKKSKQILADLEELLKTMEGTPK